MELHNLASPGRLQMNNLFGATDLGATSPAQHGYRISLGSSGFARDPEDIRGSNSLLCVLSAGAEATVAGSWRCPGQTYVRARGTTSLNGLHRKTGAPFRVANASSTRPIFMVSGAARRHENLRQSSVGIDEKSLFSPPTAELSKNAALHHYCTFQELTSIKPPV
jgi:hypothetical protein